MIEQLIPFIAASVLLTLTPGPDIIYVLIQSLVHGKKSGLVTALGLVSGILVHTTLVALGLALIIKQTPGIFNIIKVAGALYLFFLAYQSYKAETLLQFSTGSIPKKKSVQLFTQGFIMNIINPKVIIFFLAFFPGFLWNKEEQVVYQFYMLGGLFLIQALIIFSIVALLAGSISSRIQQNKRLSYLFKWIQILVYIGIALFILL